MAEWRRELAAELDELRESGRLRELRELSCLDHGRAEWNGRTYLNLSGNDYLGVAGDEAWRRAFYASLESDRLPGLSAASSRLLTGNSPEYGALERELSGLYGGRAALVFNSGYHANVGILPALAGKGDLVLSDKLNHASLIDGLQLLEADYKRFRHRDYDQLELILQRERGHYRRVFLASESVFSMDGDLADLNRLVALKHRYDAQLVLDEAHGVGVYGENGGGLAAELGLTAEIEVLVGTFGKAWGSTGAYAMIEPEVREYLINRMRTLIFSTGLPPVILRWSCFVLQHRAELAERRRRLRDYGCRLRRKLVELGWETGGESQIVPLIVGEPQPTVALAEQLQRAGILVFPIRPPTVPQHGSRLRFSLNAALPEDDFAQLLELLEQAHAL